jgi:hypothetical protein
LSAITFIEISMIGCQRMAIRSQQAQIVFPIIIRITVDVINLQREIA